MKFVAFFRNINLGQANSPKRAELESAFLQAGASTAASFLSNGTLIFSAPRGPNAQSIATLAGEILWQMRRLKEPAFVRSLLSLAKLVAENPFAQFDDPTIYERYISFFESNLAKKIRPPIESKSKDCIVFYITSGEALSISRIVTERLAILRLYSKEH